MNALLAMWYTWTSLTICFCPPDEIDQEELQKQYDIEEWEYVLRELDKMPRRKIL